MKAFGKVNSRYIYLQQQKKQNYDTKEKKIIEEAIKINESNSRNINKIKLPKASGHFYALQSKGQESHTKSIK